MVPSASGQSVMPRTVVVIAASAGGLEGLIAVAKKLPDPLPAAVVIVQHRSPTLTSALKEILQRQTTLPIVDATQGALLREGSIYLARPDRHLHMTEDGHISYADGHLIRHVLSSANPLFTSAAECFRDRTIGVVLSGGDSDATDGVQTIKQHGGVVVVQDQKTSQLKGMPASAMATGAVDYSLPLDELARLVAWLVEDRKGAPAKPV